MQTLSNIFENDDNIFLKTPHFFKPLQALTAIILAVCVGSTASGDNGILWFTLIVSLVISAAATVLFALRIQDELMESLTNGSIAWNVVELVYSFIISVLCVICVWLSFSFANRSLYSTSAGYIASGLFFIVQTSFYAVPCTVIYREVQANSEAERQNIVIEPAHPFRANAYQDL
uniref:MARVEL domain-containing protein n=1 Tax=Caenorhabditis japonica TaxID=281687 RepID=A0A8R1HWM3_CAEJA